MDSDKICYVDNHGDICLSSQEKVTICCGSHHIITINKLFGPLCIPNLKVCIEGNDWNVKNIIKRLRKENRQLKQKLKEAETK